MDDRPKNESKDEVEKRRIEAVTAKASDIIKLNVGGEKLTTKRSTLCQIEGSLLASMFSGRWESNLERDEDGRVFLDFNPKFFILILDYLRAKLIETPGRPVLLPRVGAEEMDNFRSLLDYFGLGNEIPILDQQPCSFGRHGKGVTLTENGTVATFSTGDETGVVVSNSTYRSGIVCWQLSLETECETFVGVLKGRPSFGFLDEDEDRYDDLEDRTRKGSYGWKFNNASTKNSRPRPITNGRSSPYSNDEIRETGQIQMVELTLDCRSEPMLSACLISTADRNVEDPIPLPKLSIWKLLVKFLYPCADTKNKIRIMRH